MKLYYGVSASTDKVIDYLQSRFKLDAVTIQRLNVMAVQQRLSRIQRLDQELIALKKQGVEPSEDFDQTVLLDQSYEEVPPAPSPLQQQADLLEEERQYLHSLTTSETPDPIQVDAARKTFQSILKVLGNHLNMQVFVLDGRMQDVFFGAFQQEIDPSVAMRLSPSVDAYLLLSHFHLIQGASDPSFFLIPST